jgi:hypothetical protein
MDGGRKRTRIDGQFAAREIKMLESHACCELSLSAGRVLDRWRSNWLIMAAWTMETARDL